MPVTITPTGEFDLETYCHQTSADPDFIRAMLSELGGLTSSWDVRVHDPDEYDPHGRLSIRHSCFNEHTEVVLASNYNGTTFDYSVVHPMETDILTHSEETTFEDALRTAVEVANRERRRQSRLLPPYRIPNPLTSIRSQS